FECPSATGSCLASRWTREILSPYSVSRIASLPRRPRFNGSTIQRFNESTQSMTFDTNERAVLAGLADILIPAGEGFPSASEAGVAGEGLDRVLLFRSDLAEGLNRLLACARGRAASDVVADLQRNDPALFGVLA